MASSLRFREEDDVPERIKRRRKSSLRPFVPVIVSTGGGGTTLSLFVDEKKQDETLNNSIYSYVPEGAVDLSLGLGHGGFKTTSRKRKRDAKPSIEEIPMVDEGDINSVDGRVYNPMPLQQYAPEGALDLSLRLGRGGFKVKATRRKRKREVVDPVRVPSIEEFPEVVRAIESHNGSRPVFLSIKKLEDSDVRGGLNRLFLPEIDVATVIGFLNDEERATVNNQGGPGLEVLGVDQRGKDYTNLRLIKWWSVGKTVIKSDWNKLVDHNNAEKDNHVVIWGFRHLLDHNGNDRPALAVVFIK